MARMCDSRMEKLNIIYKKKKFLENKIRLQRDTFEHKKSHAALSALWESEAELRDVITEINNFEDM